MSLYMTLVDFQKSFDKVKLTAIWNAPKKRGVPAKLINLIKDFFFLIINSKLSIAGYGLTKQKSTTAYSKDTFCKHRYFSIGRCHRKDYECKPYSPYTVEDFRLYT